MRACGGCAQLGRLGAQLGSNGSSKQSRGTLPAGPFEEKLRQPGVKTGGVRAEGRRPFKNAVHEKRRRPEPGTQCKPGTANLFLPEYRLGVSAACCGPVASRASGAWFQKQPHDFTVLPAALMRLSHNFSCVQGCMGTPMHAPTLCFNTKQWGQLAPAHQVTPWITRASPSLHPQLVPWTMSHTAACGRAVSCRSVHTLRVLFGRLAYLQLQTVKSCLQQCDLTATSTSWHSIIRCVDWLNSVSSIYIMMCCCTLMCTCDLANDMMCQRSVFRTWYGL
mgnify:CR=1 FL=1